MCVFDLMRSPVSKTLGFLANQQLTGQKAIKEEDTSTKLRHSFLFFCVAVRRNTVSLNFKKKNFVNENFYFTRL